MKIISENRDNIVFCPCGCVYQYDANDIVKTPCYGLVVCPNCGQQTILVANVLDLKPVKTQIICTSEDYKCN